MRLTYYVIFFLFGVFISSGLYAQPGVGCWELDSSATKVQDSSSAGYATDPVIPSVSSWYSVDKIEMIIGQNELPVFLCFDGVTVTVNEVNGKRITVAKLTSKYPAFARELLLNKGVPQGAISELGLLENFDPEQTYWVELNIDNRSLALTERISVKSSSRLIVVLQYQGELMQFRIFGWRHQDKLTNLWMGEYTSFETVVLGQYSLRDRD
jgi:hypothetical protein